MFGLKTLLKVSLKTGRNLFTSKSPDSEPTIPHTIAGDQAPDEPTSQGTTLAETESPKKSNPLKHVNFILLHYAYILSFAFLGSVLLMINTKFRYIDMLFFATGAATQGGLNPLDINTLSLFQQIVLCIISYFTNPIFINTCVVLIRLYWFEKRFQTVARNARDKRNDKTRAHSISGASRFNMPAFRQNSRVPDLENPRSIDMPDVYGGASRLTPAALGSPSQKRRSLQLPSKAFVPEMGMIHSATAPVPSANRTSTDNVADNDYYLEIPPPRDVENGALPVKVPKTHAESDRTLHDAAETDADGYESASGPDIEGSTISPGHGIRAARRMSNASTVRQLDGVVPGAYHRTLTGNFSVSRSPNHRNPRLRIGPFSIPVPKILVERDWNRKNYDIAYLDKTPTIVGNSVFVDLTDKERDELGGIEYCSLKTLACILLGYAAFFHLLGVTIFLIWLHKNTFYRNIAHEGGANITWWSVFTTASAFNDVGFTLNPDSMISFNKSPLMMLIGAFFIIAGNTGFPCLLRFTIWSMSELVNKDTALYAELKFLLDHPRRCFTLLFPRAATWWLLFILIALNGIDVILFVILDLHNITLEGLNVGYKILVGIFQAAATRTAGFSAINLADVHPAVQVSYMIMMYISIFPIAMTIRRTNVYEERSLGVYSGGAAPLTVYTENGTENVASAEKPGEVDIIEGDRIVVEDTTTFQDDLSTPSYIGAHLRRQLSFDLWYVFAGLLLLCISEAHRIRDISDYYFNQFAVLFELVSAYGTVGMSLGYPNTNTCFAAQFTTFGKVVIVAMLIRGRHRGLPYALDRAILLPGDSVNKKDKEQSKRATGPVRIVLNGDGAVLGRTTSAVTYLSGDGLRSRISLISPNEHGPHVSFAPAPFRGDAFSAHGGTSVISVAERTGSRGGDGNGANDNNNDNGGGKKIKRILTALLAV